MRPRMTGSLSKVLFAGFSALPDTPPARKPSQIPSRCYAATRAETAPTAQDLRSCHNGADNEAYAKVSLKKYKPMAARNEDKNVPSGLL
jgi:hypothetical protein